MTALRHAAPIGFVPVILTDRERRTLELLAEGATSEAIALKLGYSLRTIKNTVSDLCVKFNAPTRAAVIHEAHRHGYLTVGESPLHERIADLETENAALRRRLDQIEYAMREYR